MSFNSQETEVMVYAKGPNPLLDPYNLCDENIGDNLQGVQDSVLRSMSIIGDTDLNSLTSLEPYQEVYSLEQLRLRFVDRTVPIDYSSFLFSVYVHSDSLSTMEIIFVLGRLNVIRKDNALKACFLEFVWIIPFLLKKLYNDSLSLPELDVVFRICQYVAPEELSSSHFFEWAKQVIAACKETHKYRGRRMLEIAKALAVLRNPERHIPLIQEILDYLKSQYLDPDIRMSTHDVGLALPLAIEIHHDEVFWKYAYLRRGKPHLKFKSLDEATNQYELLLHGAVHEIAQHLLDSVARTVGVSYDAVLWGIQCDVLLEIETYSHVDFFLDIEFDGFYHKVKPLQDRFRNRILMNEGVHTLRISSDEVEVHNYRELKLLVYQKLKPFLDMIDCSGLNQ